MKKVYVSRTRSATLRSVKKSVPKPKARRPRSVKDSFSDSDILPSTSSGLQGFGGLGQDNAMGGFPAREEASSAPAAAPAEQRASLLSSFGGIDGIISMMTKAQQVFKLFQQMGPIFKMIGAFGGAKATTASLRTGRGRKPVRRGGSVKRR
ncbi:hypothetical protein N0M98_00365 [Paenibacillus doosanensis]|uniref:hypothetical protein n=1 Tax=Paenibacillus doosanensis TaxID=1229154 RepID=UPI00217FF684|nr:hypothetical protein [Paenibacillus doosanensis]MCS7458576.1 hypothetical protein [Paenibacillus doosanensis]